MSPCGKHMISPKEDMVDLKWSPLSNSQDMGRHVEAQLECLPAPPGNNPVIRATSSTSTAPGQLPGAPGIPPISLPTEQFQPAAELCKVDVSGIAHLPKLTEISYDKYSGDDESDYSSDLGGAESQSPISLKQTKFSLNQFAKRMRQHNFSTFNKWKKVWV